MSVFSPHAPGSFRKHGILFIVFSLLALFVIPGPSLALDENNLVPSDENILGSHMTERGYFCPFLPVISASLQVGTKAPVNVSTTAAPGTLQTTAPIKTPVVVATTQKPVLQTTNPVVARTLSTTPIPPLSILQTRTFATAVTVAPDSAPTPPDGDCPPGFFYCNGKCSVDSHENCGGCGRGCRPDQQCVNGQCACGRDTALCNGVCIPTDTDPANCGGCNIHCPSSQICSNSICTCPFETGMKFCNGTCIRTGNDTQNCGECGRRCGTGQGCIDGDCITHCNGAITNLDEDPLNCGACGHSCAADEWCSDGVCTRVPCPYGSVFCNGACVRILDNPQNCGACNRPCTYPNRFCFSGNCIPVCPAGYADCDEDGRCEDLSSGSGGYYCGSCDSMCRYNEACYAGRCWITCPQGLSTCNRGCVDVMSDPGNCGECGRQCANTQICTAGQCVTPCPQGTTRCNGTCMQNTAFLMDNNNCGSCLNRCNILCVWGICLWG